MYNRKKITLLLLTFASLIFANAQSNRYYYQLTIYSLKSKSQTEKLGQYLKDAYLPAMHRAGIKQLGVFMPVEDSILKVYVFTPYKTWEQVGATEKSLQKDKQYLKAGRE